MHFKMHHSGSKMRVSRLFPGNSFFFFFQINTANVTNGNDRTDNTQHTKRISTSIPHGYLRAVIAQLRQSFVGSTKSGRIRNRTAKNTHHHGQFDTSVQPIIQSEGNCNVQTNNANRYQVHGNTTLLERREKRRSHLETNAKDEQNKSEILQECQNLRVSRKTEMPTDNTGKQDEGYTQ